MPTKIMTRLLAGTAVSALLTGAAFAADANARPYDIPQQDAATALQAYAMQSGKQVLFPYEAAKGKQAPQIKGDFSDQEVLALLANSAGLRVTADDGKTVTLRPQAAAAAEGGDDGTVQALIVTAQKREEDIQDVPIAISAFTQEDLTRSQVAGGPDLMTQVPNFTFTKTNFSGYSIQIRGIGTQAVSATVDPAVAVAFNNTPFIRNRFFEQEFYDLERVEVLRGPQGTLYGRNATAGVVNIISAKPKYHFEAKASADIANYGSSRLEGMINLPLVDSKAALRIAGARTKRDGFVKNTITGEQTDGRDLWSARVSLRVEPTAWMTADLVYEHFDEHDDRLRSGKQLCHRDPSPGVINGNPVVPTGDSVFGGAYTQASWSQGCLPASLYSPDSFQTPNGFALPYGPTASAVGAPVHADLDPYLSATQSHDLREIETRIKPEYTASTDTVELQLRIDMPGSLTLASETGFSKDRLFSFEDFNRFNTTPGIFISDGSYPIVSPDGFVCVPQLGCSDRMMAADLSTARSQQFSQEFRLSSNYEGAFNFSLGANFLRYDTEDKYYVFFNTLNAGLLSFPGAQSDERGGVCLSSDPRNQGQDRPGFTWSDPYGQFTLAGPYGCVFMDNGDIHHLNNLGRNYFLSKNPYNLLSYAVFGEVYYQWTPNVKLTGGLRWTIDKKSAPQIPSWLLVGDSNGLPTLKVIEQEWREPTGRVAIDWKPALSFTDETLVYASYVRGYKAGGANPPPYVPIFPPICPPSCDNAVPGLISASLTHPETFEPEFVDAYEIGTKNTSLDGRLTFNVNAFYYDYTGYQISQIVDRSAVNFNFDAKIWGAELVADWRPSENLRLGFKGGYENTRVADGAKAIDLIDRTAGTPGWLVHRPFPTFPTNCIIPTQYAEQLNVCEMYVLAAAGLPTDAFGSITWGAPNNGEGFYKDLSGNSLPNAPRFTATITGDYTLPLPSDWLVTLHTDLYYQSEAWTRIFNTPGYDKLKAYTNINVAAIFTNEDAGWTVMAYVKNLMDRDSITGAFLNSDDTGLTTNVFLTEPRLYGVRVTKAWDGSEWWSSHANTSGHYPFWLEVFGDYGRFSGGKEALSPPAVDLSPADHPYPLGVQENLDWGSAGGVKLSYQPRPNSWVLSTGVRYGRAAGGAEEHLKWSVPGGYLLGGQYYKDLAENGWYSYATTGAQSRESYAIADFAIGRDVGLGSRVPEASSRLSLGLRYAHFDSDANVIMHGRPDLHTSADDVIKYGQRMHRFHANMDAHHGFQGAGPAVSWESALPLPVEPAAGSLRLDVDVGAAVLWGKQSTNITGDVHGDYDIRFRFPDPKYNATYFHPLTTERSKSATVPSLNAALGLSYTMGGLKLGGGYRWERYFDAIDGGIAERKTYDRQFDGPYFKVSVGFGG